MKHEMRKPVTNRKARPFTVYLPTDLDEWLRNEAVQNGRTLTAQTVRVLQAGRRAIDVFNHRAANGN